MVTDPEQSGPSRQIRVSMAPRHSAPEPMPNDAPKRVGVLRASRKFAPICQPENSPRAVRITARKFPPEPSNSQSEKFPEPPESQPEISPRTAQGNFRVVVVIRAAWGELSGCDSDGSGGTFLNVIRTARGNLSGCDLDGSDSQPENPS